MIPRTTEIRLRAYYRSSIFERSAFGPALARAELEGIGRQRDEDRKHADTVALKAERRAAERDARKTGERLPPRPTVGLGASTDYLPITAAPTIHTYQGEPGVEPDIDSIETAATVSRWLARIVQRGSPQTPEVLEVYFGNQARAFGDLGLPEIQALYTLTDAGKRLLAAAERLYASGKGADEFAQRNPSQRMLVLCALRTEQLGTKLPRLRVVLEPLVAPGWLPKARKRVGELAELFPACDREARQLLARAAVDLQAAVGGAG